MSYTNVDDKKTDHNLCDILELEVFMSHLLDVETDKKQKELDSLMSVFTHGAINKFDA